MPNMKRITLKDPVTGDILIPTGTGLGYELTPDAPVPPYEVIKNADTLEGHPASYFAPASSVPAERVVVQDTDDAPDSSMEKGSFSIGPSKGYIKMNAEGPAFPEPSSHTPGDVITWDNKSWLVCHYDSNNNQVYLIAKDVISTTKFDNNTYAGSTLASVAASYQNNEMSAAALAQCVNVTVNGVTAKVFVPSYEQMNGGFSWFNSNANRVAYYNEYEANIEYWTSSTDAPSEYPLWRVNADGSFHDAYMGNFHGFRPCICVQLGNNPIKELAIAENYYTKNEVDAVMPRIVTGTYIGTGGYSSANLKSIEFPFQPKVVIICSGARESAGEYCWVYGCPYGVVANNVYNMLTWTGNTLSWYNTDNEAHQLNRNGITYYYAAIG